jgi:hypothetical protein
LKRTARRLINLTIGVLVIAITITGLTACGSKGTKTTTPPKATGTTTTSPTTSKIAAASVAPKTSVSPVATKSPTPTAVPKLNEISFSLALESKQNYTESTTPIFLRTNQVLHMNWLVVKGGNHFHLTFTLPNGEAVAVRSDGTLAAYSPTGPVSEDLTKSGSLVFRPSDNDWEDGYYIFHSYITTGDQDVTIKLLYWIEG